MPLQDRCYCNELSIQNDKKHTADIYVIAKMDIYSSDIHVLGQHTPMDQRSHFIGVFLPLESERDKYLDYITQGSSI